MEQTIFKEKKRNSCMLDKWQINEKNSLDEGRPIP